MSVELALQKAIVGKLKADADLTAAVAGRVYDKVPSTAVLPYIHFRYVQAVEDSADCLDGQEVFIDLDVWSNAVGKPEASRIVGLVRSALNHQELVLDDPHALLEITHQDSDVGDGGAEGLTRGRMSFRALVESV